MEKKGKREKKGERGMEKKGERGNIQHNIHWSIKYYKSMRYM